MSDDFQLPTPSDEHKLLQESVGKWNVKCTYYMDPSQPPMECDATETIESVGPFYTASRFESRFGEMPFLGSATLGYDPHKEKWVGTWISNMGPEFYYFEGDYDADAKRLEMKGEGMFPHFGCICPFRSVQDWNDDGMHKFEFFVQIPNGPEMKTFTYLYSRAH